MFWCRFIFIILIKFEFMKIQGRKFNYLQVEKTLPNGYKVKIDMVEHPGASLIVPLVDKNHIIMLRQYRAVLDKYLYECPAGTLDPKESLLTCAKRELIEETGFEAKKIKKIGQIYPVPGYSTEVIYIFKAENLIQREIKNELDEIIKSFVISRSKVLWLFKSGRIVDAKTICGLAFLGWL